jgi:hypothetical protein
MLKLMGDSVKHNLAPIEDLPKERGELQIPQN